MSKIPYEKQYIRKRASEIIRDYLYATEESYAVIDMYFEKENGERQHKKLTFGAPSKTTPDRFRNEPYHNSRKKEGLDDE